MLEKHLGHLKKQAPGAPAIAPPPPPHMLAHMSGKQPQSLKSEDSPATSPATVTNWNSPGGMTGNSPVGSTVADEYVSTIQSHQSGPYQVPGGMQPVPSPTALSFSVSPSGSMGMPRAPMPPQIHRRQISEISGGPGDMGGDLKRQQMYVAGTPAPIAPHLGPPQSMGQPLQSPLNPMQRRPGQ